jgi:hypothetical protein
MWFLWDYWSLSGRNSLFQVGVKPPEFLTKPSELLTTSPHPPTDTQNWLFWQIAYFIHPIQRKSILMKVCAHENSTLLYVDLTSTTAGQGINWKTFVNFTYSAAVETSLSTSPGTCLPAAWLISLENGCIICK